MHRVMGTGPQRRGRCGGIAVPGWDFVAGALAAPRLFPTRRGVPGELPWPWGEHGPAYPAVPVTRRLKWSFERQALDIKGSDDCYEIHPCLLSDSLLRQRPSSVSHLPVCVSVIVAALNINVKGYWAVGIKQTVLACAYQTGLPLPACPSLAVINAGTVNGKQLQKPKSKPGVQIIFSHADLAYPHIGSLLAGSVKIISGKRERKVCFDSISEVETLRDWEAFSHRFLYIQNVWFLNKHQRESNFVKATSHCLWAVDTGTLCDWHWFRLKHFN